MPDKFEVEGKAVFQVSLKVRLNVVGYGDTEAQAKRDALAEAAEQIENHGMSALSSASSVGSGMQAVVTSKSWDGEPTVHSNEGE